MPQFTNPTSTITIGLRVPATYRVRADMWLPTTHTTGV